MEIKCHLCGERLSLNPDCPCILGEHLLRKHPENQILYYTKSEKRKSVLPSVVEEPKEERPDDCECCDCCECEITRKQLRSELKSLRQKPKKMSEKKSKPVKKDKELYKTTVETWKQGPVSVKCPFCGYEDKPCMRKQKNRVATSSLGAFFMLSCWPLCFLPFLMPEPSTIDLYCKHCGSYLGEYNRRTGALNCPCVTGDKKLHVPCSNAPPVELESS